MMQCRPSAKESIVKTIKLWIFPLIVLAVWLVVAAYTTSGLASVGASLRSTDTTQLADSPPAAAEPNPDPWVALAAQRPASGS
jgi:hypothetical protein